MDARTPDLRPLRVKLNGPSLIVLEADCGPLSVTLTPKIVLSKLNAERFLLAMCLSCVEFWVARGDYCIHSFNSPPRLSYSTCLLFTSGIVLISHS